MNLMVLLRTLDEWDKWLVDKNNVIISNNYSLLVFIIVHMTMYILISLSVARPSLHKCLSIRDYKHCGLEHFID